MAIYQNNLTGEVRETSNPYKNSEQYPDPTAHDAIKNIEEKEKAEQARFGKFIHTVLCMCDIAGYEVQGRITLIDKKSGRIWK